MEGEDEDDSLLDDASLLRMLTAFLQPGEGEEDVADRCACMLWDMCAGNPRQAGVLMQHGLMQALEKMLLHETNPRRLELCWGMVASTCTHRTLIPIVILDEEAEGGLGPLLPLALQTFGVSSDPDILREVARLLGLCVPLLKELGGLSHVAPTLSPKILFVLASSTQLPLIVQTAKLAWLLGYHDASTLRHLSPPPQPVPPPHGSTGPHQDSPSPNPAAEGGTEGEGVNDVEGGLESLIMAVVNERGEELWHGASAGLDLDTLLRCLEVYNSYRINLLPSLLLPRAPFEATLLSFLSTLLHEHVLDHPLPPLPPLPPASSSAPSPASADLLSLPSTLLRTVTTLCVILELYLSLSPPAPLENMAIKPEQIADVCVALAHQSLLLPPSQASQGQDLLLAALELLLAVRAAARGESGWEGQGQGAARDGKDRRELHRVLKGAAGVVWADEDSAQRFGELEHELQESLGEN